MAGKFVDLSDAARTLGVTPEQLVEMRSKGEIFGYRDGSSWKFKQEEVERVQSEREGLGAADDSAEILSADDADFEQMITGLSSKILGDRAQEDQADSILISDDDLGSGSGASKKGPSTIIGRGGLGGDENDISLGGREKGPGHSDALSPSDLKMKTESDVLAGSAARGPTGSATGVMGGGSKKNIDDDLSFGGSALDMGSDAGGKSNVDDDLMLAGDDSLGLDDISFSGSQSDAPKAAASSAPASLEDDDYNLSGDVLGEEPQLKGTGGSDVTFGGGDSGINLAPSDAGLSLEEQPLDLGGSAVDNLSLPGDDDDVIAMDDSLADPDQATQLKADEQFQLSPDGFIEDASDSDSGSQVIALEESDSFDHDAATQLRSDDLQPSLVAEDAFTMSPTMGGSGPMTMPAGAAAGYMMQPVEAPYSIWQVLTLMILTGILAFSGMLMVDVMSNMWSWQGTGSASTSIADSVISIFGLDK